MQNFIGTIQRIALEVDFYDSESHQGTSFLPFLGFMCFLIGFVTAFIGIIKISNARKQWNLFYDQRDRKDLSDPKYLKEKRTGQIMVVIGVVLVLASFILL